MRTKRAVALRYERQREAAPRVVAKGAGEVAAAMIELAEKSNVTVYEDHGLVDALMSLELDSVIPEELYEVVARVLTYVYQADRKA